MSTIQAVKGTRDFFPEVMAFRSWLQARIRQVSESYGYQEFDAPFLENLELYAAKSGEELVEQQAYVFEDRGGDRVALRPELTPSLARMVAQRIRALPVPLRWWSFGPFWRYEQPQKGRTREFFQWNIDLLGVDSPEADAEIVAIGADFFRAIGLGPDRVQILVNNRRLVEAQLESIGLAEDSDRVFRLIDRREKLEPDEWLAYGQELGLEEGAMEALQEILRRDRAYEDSRELVQFFKAGEAMGFGDYVHFNPTVVRGLDYYTGTVFEARDTAGKHRAVLGGGRYDNLVAAVGGDPVPGVGFAMGDVVLELVLREANAFPDLRANPADLLVTTFDDDTREASLQLANELRQVGLRAEWFPLSSSLGRQFRYADRYNIPFVVILGPEELEAGEVAIKDMASGEQRSVPAEKAAETLFNALEGALADD